MWTRWGWCCSACQDSFRVAFCGVRQPSSLFRCSIPSSRPPRPLCTSAHHPPCSREPPKELRRHVTSDARSIEPPDRRTCQLTTSTDAPAGRTAMHCRPLDGLARYVQLPSAPQQRDAFGDTHRSAAFATVNSDIFKPTKFGGKYTVTLIPGMR